MSARGGLQGASGVPSQVFEDGQRVGGPLVRDEQMVVVHG
jgi:hypothetical protein